MMRFLSLFILLFSLSLNAGPKLVFEKKVIDFGEIIEGDSAVCLFHFKNDGDTTLKITDVRPTCGCTVTDLSSYSIKPGEEGTIKAVFHSTGRKGKIAKFIYVSTNDKKDRLTRLKLTGIVKKTWDCNPKRIDFGEIKPNGILMDTLIISSTLVDTIRVDSVKTEPSELKAEIISKKGSGVKLKVSYDSSNLKWRFIGVIRFYSNIPHGRRIIIPVYARLKEEKKKE